MYNFFKRIKTVIANNASISKTVYFNFKWLPFLEAVALPVVIGRCTTVKGTGKIEIPPSQWVDGKMNIYLGCVALDWMDKKDATVLRINGTLKISNNVFVGSGCRFEVSEGATLILHENVNFTGKSTVVCKNKITFGKSDLISWDTLFMDSDAHTLIDEYGKTNHHGIIEIGKHVWIGARSTILKNAIIADDVVVAAGSLVCRSYKETDCVIGGSITAKVIKCGIKWDIKQPEKA